ncbi:multiprotein-bridging factor 1 family protein [Phenylobacterium sp.]|jgi:transcriptional regulator with XRE-family HTH domain|uniref:helix-turn-helix domain-containing protein n=1 Tax=Phenylobacterium sp. TaxID=1871053 RepID=UPI0035AEE373
MEALAFPARLELALQALAVTRARVAAELGVDKSLVGRWASGAVTPSSANLDRLSAYIALSRPGFSTRDWSLEPAAFRARLGLAAEEAREAGSTLGGWLPLTLMTEAAMTARNRGAAYEGIWKTTRPSAELPGRFLHDHVLIRRAPNGLLSYRVGVGDMRFEGWSFPLQNQLFSIATEASSGTLIFSIFNGVARQKAVTLDGLTLSCLRDAGGSPVAGACLMERLHDLSEDIEADDALFAELIVQNPVAPEGSIPDAVRDHLFRDVGPAALAAGGEAMLVMNFARSMSTGPLYSRP